jgi:hypothetical protein
VAQNRKDQNPYDVKRCPYCSVELPLDAQLCTGCNQKVGKVDRLGRAKEPIDWKAYTICAVSWLLFIFFVWWGFIRKG